MTLLTVQTLGVPEVRYQGTKLKFRSRKALALLIYLVVEPGPHSREKLIDLLWLGDPKQGRVSLRTALAQLRQALQAADAPMVVTTYDLVQIDDKRPFHLDLHVITTALRPEAAAADWQAVVNLARGQFLEGFNLLDAPAYEAWVALQRQHWYIQIEQVYQQLTLYHLDCGEEMPAMQLAGQWIAYSPLNETAYRCLMAAQARTGDRTAALQTYQQCQEILQAELAIAPGWELTALAERIRQGEMQMAERVPAPPSASQPTRLPFVGRAEEYRQLATALHVAVQGAMRITAVIGTAGMGKTHLVEAFLNGAQFDKADVDILQGRAYETGGRLPYQPLVSAFRIRLEQENAPEDLLDDVWLAELSQLLPELRARYPDLPPPLTGNADFARARLFEAFAQLGHALAARRPLILFLDDWQWAESSTRDMLHYLTQSWAKTKTPLLLVLTVRQEALLTDAALPEWLLEVERVAPLTRLELAELTAVDVHQFVQQIAIANPAAAQPEAQNSTQQFSYWLYQETGGQPFFLHERVKMLVEQGVLPAVENGRFLFDISAAWQQLQGQHPLPVPTTVRQALLARQSRLSETAQALLWASAVLGRDCTFERLCQVSGVAEWAGLSALEELLNGRLIREDRSARRPYTFAHDYIREVAYTEAGEARRRLFHRQALVALEQDNAPAAELAFHALAAQLGEPAFRHSLAAGDAGLKALAHAEALTHYEAARQLFLENRVVNGETAVIQYLYLQIGRTLELNNQFDKALATYQQMLELAEQWADARLRLASLTAQCVVHATQTPLYDGAKARICGEEALKLTQQLDDKAAEAKLLWALLLVEVWGEGNNQKGLTYALRSLKLARELGLKEQMAFTYQDMANAYRNLHQLAEAKKANQEALTIWQELGNLPMLIDAYTMQHWNHFITGDLIHALTFAEEALRLSRSINHPWSQVVALGFLAKVLTELGDPGRSAEMLRERERIMAAVESGFHITYTYLIYVGWIERALSLGVWVDVVPLAEELYEDRHNLIPVFLHYVMESVIQIKILVGKMDEAQQIWNEISPTATLFSVTGELYVLWAQKKFQLMLDRAQELAEQLRQAGFRGSLPDVLWLQGEAWMGLGQWQQAQETIAEALAISLLNGERRLRWRIAASLIEIAQIQGNQSEAAHYQKIGQDVVVYIADRIGSDNLRASFLAQPDVQAILTP